MTVLIAVLCSDGVVLGSDSMITNLLGGIGTTETKGEKVFALSDNHLFSFAGDPALAQRMKDLLEIVLIPSRPQQSFLIDYNTSISNTIFKHFQSTNLVAPFGMQSFLSFEFKGSPQCVSFDSNMQPFALTEQSCWSTKGSGKQFADPFMAFLIDVFCKHQPTTSEAEFIVSWALDHVIERNTGGVNGPIQMKTLQHAADGSYSTTSLSLDDIGIHQNAIADAKQALLDWRNLIGGNVEGGDVAPPPRINVQPEV